MKASFSGVNLLFDDDDKELLSKHQWYFDKSVGYLKASIRPRKIYFHRLKTKCPKGMQVDHINGYTVDNRSSNLRIVTKYQNNLNQKKKDVAGSLYKGVYFHKQNNNWATNIVYDGKKHTLGSYENELDAAIAVDRKYKELFGDYSWLNFPFKREEATCYIGGTFDLCHYGHIKLFMNAKKVASNVVVALNTDEFCMRYKHKKPIQSLAERMTIIKSIKSVDSVVVNIGDEDSTKSISVVRPQYILHGNDWVGESLKKQLGLDDAYLAENNIRMIYSRYTPGVSTTEIKRRINES